MAAMQIQSPIREPSQSGAPAMSLREILDLMELELARLETSIARAEVRRLEERLAWERAYRRRGLLGHLF